jgi:uncharacterized protein YecE (DUF72 family)
MPSGPPGTPSSSPADQPLDLHLSVLPPRLRVGTSSFSSDDWRGIFYPEGMSPGDYLAHYAGILPTVEIDATWYAMPSRRTVEGWARKTPEDFIISLKVPRAITHEAYLENCQDLWERFLTLLEPLGPRRGPLVFQFPYVAKRADAVEYETGKDFMRRLEAFLPLLPPDGRHVVEIRNEKWLAGPLPALLREHSVALAVVAYFTMPPPAALFRLVDPVTAPFSYVRFLGHHKRMDGLIKKLRQERGKQRDWDELIVDRLAETRAWAAAIRRLLERDIDVFAYWNNHFAGCAPRSIELFLKVWQDEVLGSS